VFFHAFSAPAFDINPFLSRETQGLHEFSCGVSHDGDAYHVTVAGKQQSMMAQTKCHKPIGIH